MIVGTSACYFSNLTKSKLAASGVDGNESRFLGSTTDPLKPYFRENGIVTTRTRAQRPEDLKTTERRRRVRTLLRTQPGKQQEKQSILRGVCRGVCTMRCKGNAPLTHLPARISWGGGPLPFHSPTLVNNFSRGV